MLQKIWKILLAAVSLANAGETAAEPDEIEALNAYRNGDEEYQLVPTDMPDIYAAFKRNAVGNRGVECPAGYAPRSDSCFANGSGHIYASFQREQCLNCPHRAED